MSLIAPSNKLLCPSCDHLYHETSAKYSIACTVCGTALRYTQKLSRTQFWGIWSAAFFLLLPAHFLPLIYFNIAGSELQTSIFTGIIFLLHQDQNITAFILFSLCIFVPFSFVFLIGLIGIQQFFNIHYAAKIMSYWVLKLRQWLMLDVYILAFIVSLVKLSDYGTLHFSIGTISLLLFTTTILMLLYGIDKKQLWNLLNTQNKIKEG